MNQRQVEGWCNGGLVPTDL